LDLGGVIAAILAGGEGRRFKPYTDIIPKPMIPLGPEEKPLLEHIILWIARHGVKRFTLLVGYRWRQIRNYFRDGRWLGVEIRYSLDTEEYRGTGGALINAYRRGLLDSETILVWYGDIVAPLIVSDLLEKHREWNADAVVVVADRYQVPVGIAEVDEEGRVVRLEEKPWLPLKATVGVLTLRTSTLRGAEEELGRSFDIMGDLIPWMIRKGMNVRAYIYSGPWYDVGSLERYMKLNHEEFKEFLKEDQPDDLTV